MGLFPSVRALGFTTSGVTRGQLYHADQLSGFIAREGTQPIGLITYDLKNGACEIVTLDSLESGKGIGSTLVKRVEVLASREKCSRVWLFLDSRRKKGNPWLWGVAGLAFSINAAILYLLVEILEVKETPGQQEQISKPSPLA